MMDGQAKILVTGSRGMLSYSLIPALKKRGHDVLGIDMQEADITSFESINSVVSGFGPDMVIHTAAMTAVDACEDKTQEANRINGEGAGNVARAASMSGAAVVAISTDYVFEGKNTRAYLETDPICPISAYGKSKALGEELVRKENEKHFIIRTAWLYGMNGKNFVDTMLRLSAERDELRVVNDQVGSPTYTASLSEAVCAVADKYLKGEAEEFFGIYHSTNSGICSWHEFAVEILRQAGHDYTKVIPISTEELLKTMNFKAPRPSYSVLDCERLASTFGVKMPDWKLGLRDYLKEKGICSL